MLPDYFNIHIYVVGKDENIIYEAFTLSQKPTNDWPVYSIGRFKKEEVIDIIDIFKTQGSVKLVCEFYNQIGLDIFDEIKTDILQNIK